MNFQQIWDVAVAENRDRLAERVCDKLEEANNRLVEILVAKTDSPQGVEAVRLLGTLGEKGYLSHDSPFIRNAAAEGIWQIVDRDARHDLLKALECEQNDNVRTTLLYVLKVLA